MTAKPKSRGSHEIFDRKRLRQRRSRAAGQFRDHDFLHRRAMEDVVDRLETVTREFPDALFIGARGLQDMVTPACGVGAITFMDLEGGFLPSHGRSVIADEEALPIAPQSVDLVVSLLSLHAANDIVGALVQARMALRPDGLFVAAAFGEATLENLRAAFRSAEARETGALAARFAPMGAIQDYGQALLRAGFALPVVDHDRVTVAYRSPARLLQDLRGMGETSCLAGKPSPLARDTLFRALEEFASIGEETFDIVYMTGWAPAQSQPKPLKPGSAKSSLAEAVKKFS